MNFFQKMYRNGLGESEDALSELRTSITNLIVIVTVPYVLAFAPVLYKLGHTFNLVFNFVLCSTLIFAYYLNHLKKKNLATIIVFVASSLLVISPIITYGRDSELQALLPIMMVFVFVLFDKMYELILLSLYIIILFLSTFYILDLKTSLIAERVYKYDYYLNMGFAIFACGFLAYIMMRTLKNYNDEQDKAFKKLAEQNRIIKKQNDEMELFTMMASHDLKTPTRTMISFLGLLDKTGEIKNPASKEYLAMAMAGASQLHDLISGISDFKNTATDKTEISYESTDAVIMKVIRTMNIPSDDSITIQRKNLHDIKIPSTELFHIFQNLIENAIKYNKSQEKVIKIESKLGDTEIIFTLNDNGIGIEKAYLDYVFDPFKKLHSSADYESTGLGLAICKKIITNYGATIRAESEGKGKGSQIIINFPIELLRRKD